MCLGILIVSVLVFTPVKHLHYFSSVLHMHLSFYTDVHVCTHMHQEAKCGEKY